MKKVIVIAAILALVIPASFYLFGPGYFNMHDDLQVMRIYELEKCLADGQIPCRWSPDMGWGYGQAMFNYYSAFPYYLGALIRIVTPLSIIGTVKMLFFLSLVGGAFGMYLLAREFWDGLGGLLASTLYTYAPYHAVDIFVRGALAEAFSLGLLPFLWFCLYRLIKNPGIKNTLLTSLVMASLATSHNISTMIYIIPTVLWALFWVIKKNNRQSILYVIGSGVLGLGMSSFFLLPAIYEQKLIQVQNLVSDYSNYVAHFVTLDQLFFSRFWGDGPSIFGLGDGMSFQIGWPHWWIIFPLVLGVMMWFKKKHTRHLAVILLGLLTLFLLSSFLTHPRSAFIWEKIPPMAFVQFPWRFLGLTIFFLSFAGGALAKLDLFGKKILYLFFLILAIILNISYFKPLHFSRLVDDNAKLTGLAFDLQRRAAIVDYLPKTAKKASEGPAYEKPIISYGSAQISGYEVSSNRFSFEADVFDDTQVEIPVTYFPGWILLVDGIQTNPVIYGDLGLISTELSSGKHIIRGRFVNTPIRSVANTISVVSIGAFFILLGISERKLNE